jgi:site-specific DNA-cytosine methylase
MRDLVLFSGMGGTTEGLVRAGWDVSLVGNCVPPPVAEHIGRLVFDAWRADHP